MVKVAIIDDDATLEAAATLFRQAMFGLPGGVTPTENWVARYLEPGRVWGAWLEGELAGTVNSYTSTMTLPGGASVPHAAVTHVGVLPHWSRRGVLRALLSQQLAEFYQRGIAVASLRASQGSLYRRFGYGLASWLHSVQIDKRELGANPPSEARIQLLSAGDAWQQQQQIAQRFPLTRAGTLQRWPQWWALQQHRLAQSSLNHYVALLHEQGEAQAFVRYHAQPNDNWLYSPERTLVVDDLHAADARHYVSLLRYLLQLDITRLVRFASRPVDDVLPLLLDNPRAVQTEARRDESWLRIIDVEHVLNTRQLSGDQSVRLAIVDPVLPHNQGHWQLTPEGACRTQQPAELTLSVDALAMLLLGGHQVRQLVESQHITVHHPSAPARLAQLFASDQQPWAGIFF